MKIVCCNDVFPEILEVSEVDFESMLLTECGKGCKTRSFSCHIVIVMIELNYS